MELPRGFLIRESSHRILDPFTPEKLATLGAALHMTPGTRLLDLCCGKGELLCTWARDHGVTGVGVDISATFVAAARARAAELEVSARVEFVNADATGYVAEEPVDIASCVGATWIGEGTAGTVELLERSLRPRGTVLLGERYWRLDPPDQVTVEGCYVRRKDEVGSLPHLVEAPLRHVRHQREYLGWGVFALTRR